MFRITYLDRDSICKWKKTRRSSRLICTLSPIELYIRIFIVFFLIRIREKISNPLYIQGDQKILDTVCGRTVGDMKIFMLNNVSPVIVMCISKVKVSLLLFFLYTKKNLINGFFNISIRGGRIWMEQKLGSQGSQEATVRTWWTTEFGTSVGRGPGEETKFVVAFPSDSGWRQAVRVSWLARFVWDYPRWPTWFVRLKK